MQHSKLLPAALIGMLFAAHGAAAFQIDQTSGTNADGSAKFSDPDDNVPFPHATDDGKPPSSHFEAQGSDNAGIFFNLAPSSQNEPDAFQRMQENREQ